MRRLAFALPLLVACTFSPDRPGSGPLDTCGDGKVDADEGCDDAALDDGDGCSATCEIEFGWRCSGAPSSCLNPPPVAEPDAIDVRPGGRVTAAVLANDTDPEGEGLRVVAITTATLGTARIDLGTNVEFEAGPTRGIERIIYTIEDASRRAAMSTLTVRVGVDNMPPVASDVALSTGVDMPLDVPLRGSDPNGDPLSFRIVSPPGSGTVSTPVNGIVRYEPTAGFMGTDLFTYVVTDGTLTSAEAVVTISVIAGNWWNAGWSVRREITIDTTGFALTTNIPVRIALDPAGLVADGAQADGDDLRFVSSNATTPLEHELVGWDTNAAAVWVRVPSLRPPTGSIWMYYGNAAATPIAAAATWSDDYDAVFHLEGSLRDSVGGTASNATHTYVDAIAGIGIGLSSDESIRPLIPNRIESTTGSLCAWLSIDTNSRDETVMRLIESNRGQGSGAIVDVRLDGSRRWRLLRSDNFDETGNATGDDGWHLVCLAWDRGGRTLELYVDGALDIMGTGIDSGDVEQIEIGRNREDNYRGPADELWLAKVPRTTDWWRAHFRLTTEPRVTIGLEERYNP